MLLSRYGLLRLLELSDVEDSLNDDALELLVLMDEELVLTELVLMLSEDWLLDDAEDKLLLDDSSV